MGAFFLPTTPTKEHMEVQEIAQLIANSQLSLEDKVSWHLRCNFTQPVPKAVIPVIMQAIWLDAYGFDWDATELDLPVGSTFDGKPQASIRALIEGHFVEPFLLDTDDNRARREAEARRAGDGYEI